MTEASSVEYDIQGNPETSLRAEIDAGRIGKPELMGFNDFQKWRKAVGKRPLKRTDGNSTSSKYEAKLWSDIMALYYGQSWSADLAAQNAVPDPEELPDAPVTAAIHTPPPREAGSPTQRTPVGFGHLGVASPAPSLGSWRSSNPGTPGTLKRRMMTDYDPTRQTMPDYQTKLRKQQEVAEVMGGSAVTDEEVERMRERAQIILSLIHI